MSPAESALRHPRVQRMAGLLPLAMLSALIVVDVFGSSGTTESIGTRSPALPRPLSRFGCDRAC